MRLIRWLQITNPGEAIHEMERLGVDLSGRTRIEGKAIHLNLKVEQIDPRTANLLKQEMLSLGGDAAVDIRSLDCTVRSTDALLMGTQQQMEVLATRLALIPNLQSFSDSLKRTLRHITKRQHVLKCRKKSYVLGQRTLLMGVLNVTPDSFSDGGLYFDLEKAVAHGLHMIDEGADIIDIGGESTRPGSKPLELEEELRRVIPVIEALARRGDTPISIDTFKSAVAQRAIEAGAEIINDISGLHFDPGLADVAARENAPLVLMHIRGTPETMQKEIHYDSLFSEILQYLKEGIDRAESAGVDPDQIIIDPGFGFGKTLQHNLLILQQLAEFRVLGKPILLGTSRKSFLGKLLHTEVQDRLEGTLASIVIGVLNGAHIVRVHDVLPAKRAIAVADAIRLAQETESVNETGVNENRPM